MRIAYLDCAQGASGDMLLASLVDAGLPLDEVASVIRALGLDDELTVAAEETTSGGFRALRLRVDVRPGKHRTVEAMLAAVDGADLPDAVRARSRVTIERLADVESGLHGIPRGALHLHELSGADTLVDVVGFHAGCERLGIVELSASAVNVGSGMVTFSHGTFAVPAPATGELLRGVPLHGDPEPVGELTTPTAAAILVTTVARFGPMPPLRLERVGYAVGARVSARPRVLRCFVGEATG